MRRPFWSWSELFHRFGAPSTSWQKRPKKRLLRVEQLDRRCMLSGSTLVGVMGPAGTARPASGPCQHASGG